MMLVFRNRCFILRLPEEVPLTLLERDHILHAGAMVRWEQLIAVNSQILTSEEGQRVCDEERQEVPPDSPRHDFGRVIEKHR